MEPYQTPNLPGFSFNDPLKTDYRRGQYFKVSSGLMGSRPPSLSTVTKQIDEHAKTIHLMEPTMKPTSTFLELTESNRVQTPETPVLRFYAYFREGVTESADEEERIRYVTLTVFLEDETVLIQEKRTKNSGMDQGVLLKRMRVLNPNAEPYGQQYKHSDFRVGINIEIFGITYRIYACDKFTEQWYQKCGLDIGQFEDPPDDLYSVKRELTERPIRVTKIDTDKTGLKQFLEYDGQVLRFFSVWDDKTAFGEKRKFLLQYYLVDDTIEIRQLLDSNSGRDPVPLLLKKSKLVNPETEQPYTVEDLRIGKTVDVYGRSFLIYDADVFTQKFIDKKYGPQDWTPIPVVFEQKVTKKVMAEVPEFNGWGDEQDSLGSVTSLHPKPPKKDVVKLIARDGQVLRLAAKFKDPAPQDRLRKFVICYYLQDDTVAVFEVPQRNSGFKEGKFIQRSKLKNVNAGNRYFQASDFVVGAEIVLNGFKFITYDADEYAFNLMEAESDDFPQSNLSEIILSLRSDKNGIKKLREAFASTDRQNNGYTDPTTAQQILMRVFNLPQHEALTIIRRWKGENGFDYNSLLSVLN